MGELLLILVSTSLVNNLVLDYMLGTDPIIAVSRKQSTALDLCILVIIVMPAVSLSATVLNFNVLLPLDLPYLQPVSMVLLVSSLISVAGMVIKLYLPVLHRRIGVLIPLIMVNCTVLGMALLSTVNRPTPAGSVFYGLGSAIGFSFTLMAITPIREKVSVSDVPFPFKGVAILMITLGMLSMAFMGFDGINTIQ